MKKKLLFTCAILFCFTSFSQTTISLGTYSGQGSTNVLLSTSTTNNRYSRTISIYTASEIQAAGGTAGNIVSLAWDKNGTGEYQTNDAYIKIYLKHINLNLWNDSDVPDWSSEIAGATEVFTSSTYSIPTGTGWKEVPFTTPFVWNGTENVAVMVEWDRSSTPTASIFWGRSTNTDTNATRVGSTSLNALVFLINDNRPLVQLTFDGTASVGDSFFDNFIHYPNPVESELILDNNYPIDEVTVYNMLGQVIAQHNFNQMNQIKVNFSDYKSGSYFLRVVSDNSQKIITIIKK